MFTWWPPVRVWCGVPPCGPRASRAGRRWPRGDGGVDLGSLGVGKAYEVAVDSVDQLPDSSDLLLGGSGVGTSPFIETVDGSGQPFPGAQQIVEVAGQVW